MRAKFDPVRLEVFKNLFTSVAEEMGVALRRSSFSPNIKERLDFSCAIFNSQGEMVAQAAHIPVHLGSMPLSVQTAIKEVSTEEGDVVLTNDPFRGGNHLPDLTLVAPLYVEGGSKPLFYIANRAHHADVGGITPGSMPLSQEIFEEGIVIPPVKIVRKGRLQKEILEVLLANVRTPNEREGDLTAQLAAIKMGQRRLPEIVARYGERQVTQYADFLLSYGERMVGHCLKAIPNGSYYFEDFLDDDGIGGPPVKIAVNIEIKGSRAVVDFSNSAPQVKGNMNAVYSIVNSAVFYVFRSLAGIGVPENGGCMRPIRIVAPEGSVVNARAPAAVAGGNVEVSQRMVDVLLGALAQARPDLVPAASSGSMNNLTIGGWDPRRNRPFAYYETVAGGMGARPFADGLDAVHTHMTNTLNTPVEALEYDYPLMVKRYCLRPGSGGKGKFSGGKGIIREILALTDVQVTILSERRKFRPYGLAGGEPGKPGKNYLITTSGQEKLLPSKVCLRIKKGEIIGMATPGGGGHGKPGR